MQLLIDALNSIIGWTASDDTRFKVQRINDIDKFIANEQSSSLLLKAIGDANNQYVEKTFPSIDVSNYDELVMWVYSSRLNKSGMYLNRLSDFKYKIDFNNTMLDFCIPLYDTFTPIVFDIRDITSIDRIRITALHDLEDYLIISSLVAYKDQIPLDIYRSAKSKIEIILKTIIGNDGILIGNVNSTAGNKRIKITGNKDFITRFSVIKISDGVNFEIHQLGNNDEERFDLIDSFDGESILHNYSGANVYLQIPVEYGLDKKIILPGILIKGWTLTPILRGSKTGKNLNSYRENQTVKEQYVPQIEEWFIEFHMESRSEEILQYMSDAVRKMISSDGLWINGKQYEIGFHGDPVYIEPFVPEDLLHKITYTMKIEIQEYWDTAITLPNTTDVIDNIYIKTN